MDRTSRGAALVAVLGVVALAAAAAGVPVATSSGGGGAGGPAPGTGAPPPAPTAPDLGGVPPVLVAAVVLAALGVLLWTLLRGDPPARVAVVLVALVLFVGLAALLDLLFRGGAAPAGGLDAGLPGGASEGGGETGGGGLAVPPALLVAAAAVAVALPAGAFVLARDRSDPAENAGDADSDARATIARAAGRAADRIEGGERALDNEVYRCWREMTTPLEPTNPAATTPAEFERTAVDRGVDPDHARELTALFERVRYGGRSPGEDDERRAVELLRRIEAADGDAGPDPDDGGEGQ